MKNDFVMPILVLTLICLIFTGALAFTNSITEPIIAAAAAERENSARYALIPAAEGFELIAVDGLPATVREIYKSTNDVGFIFIVTANGYGGELRIMCGIDATGTIIRSSVLAHSETKGLGAKIEDPPFADQFAGVDRQLVGVVAISGATISTNAYMNAIRDAFAAYDLIGGAS